MFGKQPSRRNLINVLGSHTQRERNTVHQIYLRDGPKQLENLYKINKMPKHAILFSLDVFSIQAYLSQN